MQKIWKDVTIHRAKYNQKMIDRYAQTHNIFQYAHYFFFYLTLLIYFIGLKKVMLCMLRILPLLARKGSYYIHYIFIFFFFFFFFFSFFFFFFFFFFFLNLNTFTKKAIIHSRTQFNTYFLRWIDNGFGSKNGDHAGEISIKTFGTNCLYASFFYFLIFIY